MENLELLPKVKEYLSSGEKEKLNQLFSTAHPVDIAGAISQLEFSEALELLKVCNPDLRAEVFSHLGADIQVALSEMLDRHQLADLLKEMSPDDRVDLIQNLPPQKREVVLGAMAQAEREDIRKLAVYEKGTTGAVMTSDYVSLSPGMTAGEALNRMRHEAPDKETIYYAYVIDGVRRLIGFVSLKDLILADPNTHVADIMHRDVIYANANDDQEETARKIQKYDLLAIPVVNGNRVLVGIVTHDDAMDIITQEQTEDIEKFMAIRGPHEPQMYLRSSAWRHFRQRVLWIVILAALGLVSGYIVESFTGLLMQFAILATFMPMLADTGGNAGSQSATLVIRALALKEIRPADVLSILWKELQVSILLGLVLAVLAFVRVILFSKGNSLPHDFSVWQVGIAISTALCLQVITSTLLGALLPLFAAKIKIDPAVIASPALTTVVDITGLFLYFITVKLMLRL